MALRFMDGFEMYNTSAASALFWGESSGVTIATSTPRYGSRYLSIESGYVAKLFDDQATWIVGFGFRPEFASGSNDLVCSIRDTGNIQCDLRYTSLRELMVTRNGTELGRTSANVVTQSVWAYVEWKLTVNNTTGVYEVRVNGVNELSATGVDTQNTGNATANKVFLHGGGSGEETRFDDVYVCDGSGAAPHNDFLGDSKVLVYMPNAAGDSSQFTPLSGSNYQNVDETPPDGDTTYNSSSTATHLDLYNIADASITGTIHGVQVSSYVRKDDAGSRTVKNAVKAGTTTDYGSNESLGDNYDYFHTVWEDNPDDSQAWTDADIDSLQIGLEVVS